MRCLLVRSAATLRGTAHRRCCGAVLRLPATGCRWFAEVSDRRVRGAAGRCVSRRCTIRCDADRAERSSRTRTDATAARTGDPGGIRRWLARRTSCPRLQPTCRYGMWPSGMLADMRDGVSHDAIGLARDVLDHGLCDHCRSNAAWVLEAAGQLDALLEELGIDDPRSWTSERRRAWRDQVREAFETLRRDGLPHPLTQLGPPPLGEAHAGED